MADKKKTPPSWSSESRAKTYREDEDFRESAKKRSRDSYRKRAWGDTEITNAVHLNLRQLGSFGQIRKVGGVRCKTFTVPEMTNVLVRSVSMYRRWVALQQVPPPTYDTPDGVVYKMVEARAIATTLAAHFDEFGYYRQDHADTKAAVWKAYWAVQS